MVRVASSAVDSSFGPCLSYQRLNGCLVCEMKTNRNFTRNFCLVKAVYSGMGMICRLNEATRRTALAHARFCCTEGQQEILQQQADRLVCIRGEIAEEEAVSRAAFCGAPATIHMHLLRKMLPQNVTGDQFANACHWTRKATNLGICFAFDTICKNTSLQCVPRSRLQLSLSPVYLLIGTLPF